MGEMCVMTETLRTEMDVPAVVFQNLDILVLESQVFVVSAEQLRSLSSHL